MSIPSPSPTATTVTGSLLGKATALSSAPDAAAAQIVSTARDRAWFAESVPCRTACPAGTDVPGYLEAIYRGDHAAAYRINLEDNIFPGVLGRVCSRPCEDACRHGAAGNGEPVAICASKRAAADHRAADAGPVLLPALFPLSGKRVAIIGAGVAGLACARELVRRGHRVSIYEKHRAPGGMLIQGIPMFRLPREVVEREIAQITALGVELHCGVSVGPDLPFEQLAAGHDAIIVAAGTLAPNIPHLDNADAGAEHGLRFLLEVNEFQRRHLVKPAGTALAREQRVIVIGGGYTALDCGRTALRMGAHTVIAYRRGRGAMNVLAGEIEEFQREGGILETQIAPLGVVAKNGRITGLRFIRTREGARTGPFETLAGSEFESSSDHVIFATGQNADHDWLPPALATDLHAGAAQPRGKVFTAGDFALGATTLIAAIGHAKQCAQAVDRYLMGSERSATVLRVSGARYSKPAGGAPAGTARASLPLTGRDPSLNRIPLIAMPLSAPEHRGLEDEVELGFPREAAAMEASRCYLCNYKFEIIDRACVLCDECLRVTPVEGCIVEIAGLTQDAAGRVTGYRKVERDRTDSLYYNRLWIDATRCIRCGACEAVCPVNAISVQKISCESSCR